LQQHDISPSSRRQFLAGAAAALPVALGGAAAAAQEKQPVAATLPAPKFTLSVNLELMFPREMPYEERLQRAADEGAKAYSFWAFRGKDLDKLKTLADKHGMACGSITGANKTGFSTGLTKTGAEQAFLDDFREAVEAAKKVGAPNLITFVGETQTDISLDMQHAQIVSGLKKAGEIAAAAGVYLTLEPLSVVHHPKMSVLTAQHAYRIMRDVAHPHIKVDFDMFHLQHSEGNLTLNLQEGLTKGYVRFVEVGDVPGRFEPGTGETNYAHMFGVLREAGYAGFVGMEHRARTDYKTAIAAVRRLAGFV